MVSSLLLQLQINSGFVFYMDFFGVWYQLSSFPPSLVFPKDEVFVPFDELVLIRNKRFRVMYFHMFVMFVSIMLVKIICLVFFSLRCVVYKTL